MNTTFDRLYRQLGRVTFGVLIAALTFLGLALLFAMLGLPHVVDSCRGVAFSLAYVFAVLFSLFLVTSLVAALIRWLDRRNQIKDQNA